MCKKVHDEKEHFRDSSLRVDFYKHAKDWCWMRSHAHLFHIVNLHYASKPPCPWQPFYHFVLNLQHTITENPSDTPRQTLFKLQFSHTPVFHPDLALRHGTFRGVPDELVRKPGLFFGQSQIIDDFSAQKKPQGLWFKSDFYYIKQTFLSTMKSLKSIICKSPSNWIFASILLRFSGCWPLVIPPSTGWPGALSVGA